MTSISKNIHIDLYHINLYLSYHVRTLKNKNNFANDYTAN